MVMIVPKNFPLEQHPIPGFLDFLDSEGLDQYFFEYAFY